MRLPQAILSPIICLDSKAWLCMGNTFLKVESSVCEEMLNKGQSPSSVSFFIRNDHFLDKETLETEITKLRDGLKPKVNQLHKMEGSKSHRHSIMIYAEIIIPCLTLLYV